MGNVGEKSKFSQHWVYRPASFQDTILVTGEQLIFLSLEYLSWSKSERQVQYEHCWC